MALIGTMTIGELARRAHVNPRTLRYYERIGLLMPSARTDAGYRLYTERGDEFVPRYIELLAAGGSRSPEELGKIVGVDLTDPGFWDAGLALIQNQLTEAEALAA